MSVFMIQSAHLACHVDIQSNDDPAGYKWTLNFYRLVIYATLLLPGFIQV